MGDNTYGESTVPDGLANVVAVSAGAQFSLALKDNGRVQAWGHNDQGQTTVPSSLINVVAIAAGWYHAMALTSDGHVTVWGSTTYGAANVPPEATDVVAVASGDFSCLALKADGTVLAWGYSIYGQTNVPAGLTKVTAIAAGDHHSLALVGSGPLPQLALLHPVVNSAGFSVSVPSQNGRVYRLEYKDSLDEPNWTPLPLVAGTGSTLALSDPAPVSPARFYRVRRW